MALFEVSKRLWNPSGEFTEANFVAKRWNFVALSFPKVGTGFVVPWKSGADLAQAQMQGLLAKVIDFA